MDTQQSPSKLCAACNERKPLDAFHRQPSGPLGRHSWCKTCFNARAKASRKKTSTPEQKRRWNLASRYGLTPAEVEALAAQQAHACAICRGPLTRPHIDHCHRTGKVRGILCHPCNIKLPAVEDEAFLKAARAYLSRS